MVFRHKNLETHINLDQSTFVENILRRFELNDWEQQKHKPRLTKNCKKIFKPESSKAIATIYENLVGELLLLVKPPRFDTMYITKILSRFKSETTSYQWSAGKRVLRYLRYPKRFKLTSPRDSCFELIEESDADWSGNVNNRQSTTAYYFKPLKKHVAENWTPQNQRSDNGREYKNKKLNKFCVKNKINHEFTIPEIPEKNGVAERYNKTLIESARCLLVESRLPKCYWVRADCVKNLLNRKTDRKSSFKKMFKRKRKTDLFKILGYLACVENNNARNPQEFDIKAQKCVFLANLTTAQRTWFKT